VIAPVREYLKEQSLLEPPRATDVLHPSEMSQVGWCPRAAYFKLKNPPPPEYISFRQRNIFEYGHAAHGRWQGYLADMGKLEGYWRCQCGHKFYHQGRPVCRRCQGTAAEYRELTLNDPELMIGGHTDGLLFQEQAILEIKTVGEGTVRYYAPQLIEAHTHEIDGKQIVDLKGLWDSIRRPFSSHLRQGMTYAYLARRRQRVAKVDKVVFLYESKMTQDVKEFVIKYDESLIKPLLAGARAVAQAMRGEGPIPQCRAGAQRCTACQTLEGAVL
jgi:hypothetical protein